MPIRLLDWSESPLVALYFALSSDEDAKTDAAVWVLNPMRLNKKVGYGEYVPPISYDSLRGDLEGAFSNHDNDDYGLQNRIIACHTGHISRGAALVFYQNKIKVNLFDDDNL